MMNIAMTGFRQAIEWVHGRCRVDEVPAALNFAARKAPGLPCGEPSMPGQLARFGTTLVAQVLPAGAHASHAQASVPPARLARLELDRIQHVWLLATEATDLTAISGVAWITFERNTDDVVILPGQSFLVPAGTMVLVGTLRGSAKLVARGAFDVSDHGEGRGAAATNRH